MFCSWHLDVDTGNKYCCQVTSTSEESMERHLVNKLHDQRGSDAAGRPTQELLPRTGTLKSVVLPAIMLRAVAAATRKTADLSYRSQASGQDGCSGWCRASP